MFHKEDLWLLYQTAGLKDTEKYIPVGLACDSQPASIGFPCE